MIELDHVEVVFGAGTPLQKVAARDLSLKIREGEFVTVVGSNGAGKSTLLGVLAASIRPTTGAVRIDGEDVSRQTEVERSSLVARVFQDPLGGTCGALSIEENLSLAASRGGRKILRKAIRAADREKFRSLLKPLGLGLEDRLKSEMSLLSGGQRQAVSLLMASLSGSRLLLLDEHTAALDPATADLVLRVTRRIIEERKLTTLMVTHSMQQALTFGTRTVMLDKGSILFDVAGVERTRMTVQDLLKCFPGAREQPLE